MQVIANAPELDRVSEHTPAPPQTFWRLHRILFLLLIVAAIGIRIHGLGKHAFWSDESIASLGAFTILEQGYPEASFNGLPLFENNLVKRWPESREYEFRDISYGRHGLKFYHGWLPLYALAGTFRIFGVEPPPPATSHPIYTMQEIRRRTVIARIPSVIFGILSVIGLYYAGALLESPAAGLIAMLFGAALGLHISYSQQAGYYAPTLAAAAWGAWSILWMIRASHWKSFIAGALVFSAVFYIHLVTFIQLVLLLALSLFIFGRARLSHLIPKLAVFSGIIAMFCVPWIAATGILQERVAIPSAKSMMSLPGDLLFKRQMAILLFPGLALILAILLNRRIPILKPVAALVLSKHQTIAFVYLFLLVTYLSYFAIVPAAAFGVNRLALDLLIPAVLLLAVLCWLTALAVPAPYTGFMAALLAFTMLLAFDKTAPALAYSRDWTDVDAITSYLKQISASPGARFYATPNEHLTLMFYTGMPFQSIAPVRKNFLDSYPGDIIYLEWEDLRPTPAIAPQSLKSAFASMGRTLPDSVAQSLSCRLASYDYRRQLATRIASVSPLVEPLPAPVLSLLHKHESLVYVRANMIADNARSTSLLFKQIRPRTNFEWWNGYFYAYTGAEARMKSPNYADRFRNARAIVLPCSNWIAYRSPGLPPHSGE